MRRRDFITLVGGTAAAWPLAGRAQQDERTRRIGVLMGFGENDAEGTLWLSSFTRALQELGWTDGQKCGWMFVGAPRIPNGSEYSRKN